MSMNILPGFPDEARVWVFQSTRPLTPADGAVTAGHLDAFTQNWASHSVPVRGGWQLVDGHFIVVAADEASSGVSGCSTDGLIRVIQQLSALLGVDLFDRLSAGLRLADGSVVFTTYGKVRKGEVPEGAAYYDLTVTSLGELREGWPGGLGSKVQRFKSSNVGVA